MRKKNVNLVRAIGHLCDKDIKQHWRKIQNKVGRDFFQYLGRAGAESPMKKKSDKACYKMEISADDKQRLLHPKRDQVKRTEVGNCDTLQISWSSWLR